MLEIIFFRRYFAALVFISLLTTGLAVAGELQPGSWNAHLDIDGHELRFGLEIVPVAGGYSAWLLNGEERLEVPKVYGEDGEIVFDIDHYDAGLRGIPDASGKTLDGWWWRRFGAEGEVRLPFHGELSETLGSALGSETSDRALAERYARRWAVKFAAREDSSVGIFRLSDAGTMHGTFLNTSGDYRMLSGTVEGGLLKLSRFDGAHAFYFEAALQPDQTLRGEFWEGGYLHDTWSGREDSQARLSDSFAHFQWTGTLDVEKKRFYDLDGKPCSLLDPLPAAKGIVVELFGTWCPNCHDSMEYLMQLHQRYRSRGLSVIGLAFEMQASFERSAAMVRLYKERFGAEYPLLLAAKGAVRTPNEVFSNIQGMYGIPTIIFLHGDGRIRAVHTGFTGPATGEAYDELRASFEKLAEELLK